MDSLIIKPKDERELKYVEEVMNNLGALYKRVSQDALDEFEIAMMIKDKAINTAGIIREDTERIKLTPMMKKILADSEIDIQEKVIISEFKIQTEEDEWLTQ